MSALTRHLLLCFSLACGLLLAPCARAGDLLPEYTVKAGYIYNFAMLTEWPSDAVGENLELCVTGNDDLGTALKTLQGKTASNRQINVRTLAHPGEAKGCHVLFIAELARSEFAQLKREIAGQAILTVTDNADLAKSGVAIFLRPEHQRLVFEIDAGAAKLANLNISARLLRLARGGAGL
jgi:hypothetical protein